jgi:hypothetical protein
MSDIFIILLVLRINIFHVLCNVFAVKKKVLTKITDLVNLPDNCINKGTRKGIQK